MRLTMIGTTSTDDGCPTLYRLDGDHWVVQGYRMDPRVARFWTGVGEDGKNTIEVPGRLLDEWAADRSTWERGAVTATTHGTYVVRGSTLQDQEALETVRSRGLPEHEDTVVIRVTA